MRRNQLLIGVTRDEMLYLDTIDDLNINITKSIYIIEDPSKRRSDFSKTISVPGSKNNDDIFKSLFDVNFYIRNDLFNGKDTQLNPDFNPRKKATCMYLQDGEIQIMGYCQLVSITVLDNNSVTYDIVIYGGERDLFSALGNKKLSDLNTNLILSYDDTTIKDSWTGGNGFVYYPLIDNGQAFAYRQGTVVPNASVDYNSFRPWFNVSALFKLIINETGFKSIYGDDPVVVSDFFDNSPAINDLWISADEAKMSLNETVKDASKSEWSRTTNETNGIGSFLQADAFFNQVWHLNNLIQDNFFMYDTVQGEYIITDAGNYSMDVEYAYIVDGTGSTGKTCDMYIMVQLPYGSYPSNVSIIASDQKLDGSGTTFITGAMSFRSRYFVAGTKIRVCSGFAGTVVTLPSGSTSRPTAFGTTYTYQASSGLPFKANLYKDGAIYYGSTYRAQDVMYDIKQSDFIMGVCKMFNLYIYAQPDGNYFIEPRDVFFRNTVTDWTQKLDTSKPFVINPQGLLLNKEIDFLYTQNDDDVSKDFYSYTGKPFGYKTLIFDNDFVKDVKKVEIPFICEPLQTSERHQYLMKFNRNGGANPNNPAPIIAYGKHNLPCDSFNYYDYNAMTYTTYYDYPYIGFLNDPDNPTLDLCFDEQDRYYHRPITTTNQGLYNVYHRKQWLEIGDKNSKLVKAYFNLNSFDISNINFRNIFWVDNAAYRLLEVVDYSPNNTSTTLCNLLKLQEASDLVATTTKKTGGGSNGNDGNGDHIGGDGNGDQMGLYNVRNGIWQGGFNNKIFSGNAVIVTGINNTVGSNCINIQISGNNNIVAPNCQNVILINCDGIQVTDSDVVYMDNVRVVRHYVSETAPVLPAPRVGDVWYKITP